MNRLASRGRLRLAASIVVMAAGAAGIDAARAEAPPAVPAALAAPPAPLTLPDAERMALVASPTLKAAVARIRQEDGLLRQAGLYPNPDLSVDTNWYTHDFTPRETIIGLKQPIPYHGKRGLEQKAAAERIVVARAEAVRERLDLLQRVREGFYQLGFAGKILALAHENLETATTIHDTVEKRVSAGDAPPFEALKASVEVRRAAGRVRQVEWQMAAGVATFDLLLGLPADTHLVVADPPAPDVVEEELAPLLARALATQPEIQAREHEALADGYAAERARLENRPDVAVGPTFGWDTGDPLIGLGLSLRLPVWNHSQGLVAAAVAATDAARFQVDAARQSVSGRVVEAYGRYRSAVERRRLYEEGLLAEADEVVDLTRKSYEGGASGILDLLDARRIALDLRVDYYGACLDAALAAVNLRRIAGAEPADEAPAETP